MGIALYYMYMMKCNKMTSGRSHLSPVGIVEMIFLVAVFFIFEHTVYINRCCQWLSWLPSFQARLHVCISDKYDKLFSSCCVQFLGYRITVVVITFAGRSGHGDSRLLSNFRTTACDTDLLSMSDGNWNTLWLVYTFSFFKITIYFF